MVLVPVLYNYFLNHTFLSYSQFLLSIVFHVLPISFVAGAGDQSYNGANCNISNVIWGWSPARKDFVSALLIVCMFNSTMPFGLYYLGLEDICLKSRSWENVLYSLEINWLPLSLTTLLLWGFHNINVWLVWSIAVDASVFGKREISKN